VRIIRRWIELAVRHPARSFARNVIAFDEEVLRQAGAGGGLREAARGILRAFTDGLTVGGAERVPPRGPVLLVSNHPGMTDTVALFAAVPRADLRILAADRPFLRALTAAARQLIFIPEGPEAAAVAGRAAAVRAAVAHLRAGGALLTFPAGVIEPDPAVLPGAVASLERWSPSTALFLRRAPGCVVVPVIVSGVLSRRAQHHPLTLLRRKREDREWLGSMLQIVMRTLVPGSWPVRVRVDFLASIPAESLPPGADEALAALKEPVAAYLRESRKGAFPVS
jgi:1-acyl-sn-glycerol-3-phosphate acyltransferase